MCFDRGCQIASIVGEPIYTFPSQGTRVFGFLAMNYQTCKTL